MTYGKIFASCFGGSMVGAGPDVFSVWSYVIAHAVEGVVELNPAILSTVIGCPHQRIEDAITFLCSPDPRSRNKDKDGQRMIQISEYAYEVVSHSIYKSIRNEEDRRAYNRAKKQESRERMSKNVKDVIDMSAVSAHSEAYTYTETITSPPAQRKKLPIPSEDLDLFNTHVWKPYPFRSRDGKPLGKGHKPEALRRANTFMRSWRLSWEDMENTVIRYAQHPNVKQGMVQAAEVFFGDNGHALECWEFVKRVKDSA